jgi:hypothetical protein
MAIATPRLRSLPAAARVLIICFLLSMGAGFAAAQVNLQLQHAGLDGRAGLSLDDVVIAFHGREGSTVLTTKIGPGGSMARYIPRPRDREVLESWVASGAGEQGFEEPADVLQRLCVRCHNPLGEMPGVPFAPSRAEPPSLDLVAAVTGPDTGVSYLSLARSSHAHLFGMGVLYALAGLVFLLTDARPRTKALTAAAPFVAMFLDIGCWWLTKLHAGFAVGIVAGGALLGLAFAVLILRPLWELCTPGRPAP